MIIVSGSGTVISPAVPTDIATNLELWLPVSALSGANDDPISTWEDQSGNNRDATGTGAGGAKPLYKTAGGPAGGPSVRLTDDTGAIARWFTLPDFLTGFTSGEAFIVTIIKADPGDGVNAGNGPPLGEWGSATTGSLYPFWTDSNIYEEFGTTVRKTTTNPVTSLATWHLYNVRSASGSWQRIINAATTGNDFFTTATNTVGWSTVPKIGRDDNAARYLMGSVVDVIFCSRVLDDATERKAIIHAYLNNTYGFALPIV